MAFLTSIDNGLRKVAITLYLLTFCCDAWKESQWLTYLSVTSATTQFVPSSL